MTRLFSSLLLTLALALPALPALGQNVRPPDDATRSATPPEGGAAVVQNNPTLEDILRRQEALASGDPLDEARAVAQDEPATPVGGAPGGALGTLGGASDSDLWRALRADTANVTVSTGGEVAKVLVQDGGMRWMTLREGPLKTYGGGLLGGVVVLLVVFFLLRGRIRIEGGKTGVTVTRFRSFERAAHWLLAGSFILLGLTGLASLFGRTVLLPLFGPDANAGILVVSKWVHNNVAWPFMVALIVVFFLWVWHNIPDRTDLRWVAQGGGFVGSKHPPAKKFNFGQKMIFWSVIVLGASVSASGLSLLFPFELPMFAATFEKANALGVMDWLGRDPLPTALSPQEEMQFSQIWHAIVSFVMMAIVLAHIYIGSLGMEGAYDAMGSGEVDVAWAEQHHRLWLEEVQEGYGQEVPEGRPTATPAE